MPETIEAPLDFVQELAAFQFPASTQERLDRLMERNAEGVIEPAEREELKALVELNERLSILKGRALLLLGRTSD
jgi:hypothetical protein